MCARDIRKQLVTSSNPFYVAKSKQHFPNEIKYLAGNMDPKLINKLLLILSGYLWPSIACAES